MKNKEKMNHPLDKIKGKKTPPEIKKQMDLIHKRYGKILRKLANE